jgi:glycosyltransferase involved in cell wall biosynthesis
MRCPDMQELPPPPAGKTGWPWAEASPALPRLMPDGRPWPRVSVVTPSYNQVEYLEETIRSVLLQGYPDLEYIVVDNCSTDGSVEIIGKYERWLANSVIEPDRGQTDAINKGWRRSTGSVVAYLNADDFYLPGAIAAAVEAFRATPEAGMVYATAMIVDEAGDELRPWQAEPFDLKTMLVAGSIVPQPAAFYSIDALEAVGYVNERWHMIMDFDLAIRIGTRYTTVCIPATLAKFRAHSESKTRIRFETMAAELIEFLAGFRTDGPALREWLLRRQASSRIYYELSQAYLGEEGLAVNALRPLLRSILCYPPFTLRRPLLTAHIVKKALAGPLRAVGRAREPVKRTG